jgi:SAM-dependent methyltransferase
MLPPPTIGGNAEQMKRTRFTRMNGRMGARPKIYLASVDWVLTPVSCNVCGPGPERTLGRRGGDAHWNGAGITSRIVQCARCGLIYPNPMPIPAKSAAPYVHADEYFRNHPAEEKVASYAKILAEAERLTGGVGRLLDVGCGRGEALAAAAQRGWTATGVEMSPDFAAYAKAQYGVDVRVGDLSGLTLPERSFDCVLLGAVLEHVFDPLGLLREIHRVTRAGGVLWIDVPNEEGLYFRVGNLMHRLRGRDWVINLAPTWEPYHVQGFSPRSIRVALRRAEFDIVELTTAAAGPVSRATGLRKWLQFGGSALVDQVGARIGAGSYLDVWARAV